MPQKAIELILMRQLADCLTLPILLFDQGGNLVFYNEPAEALLGHRFDETGEITLEEWYTIFRVTAEDGSPVPLEDRPLIIALNKGRAAHRDYLLQTADGITRRVGLTALPLDGQGTRYLGAAVVFWEAAEP